MKHTLAVIAVLAALAAHALAAPAANGRGKGVHYLYLVRHGETAPDTVRNASDVTARGLSALGHAQAKAAGARLAALPLRPQSITTSHFLRARESANEIGALLGLTPVVDTLLHECTPHSERADYMDRHGPEAIVACDSNLVAAWRRYFIATPDADRRDVLVCHANVIRWLVARVLSERPENWPRFEIANGSITVVAIDPDGRAKLVAFSDTGHLPVEQQTWSGKSAGWGSAERK